MSRRALPPSTIALALLGLLGTTQAQVAPSGYERAAAAVHQAAPGRSLADVRGATPGQAVTAALAARGRSVASVAALRASPARAGAAGATHAHFEQVVDGLAVHGAYAKATFNREGALVHLIDHLADVSAQGLAATRVDAAQALRAVLAQLHPQVQASLRAVGQSGNITRFEGSAFFHSAPTVEAVAVPMSDGSMSRGWRVQTWTQRSNQLHYSLVGGDGQVLDVESRTANDSYNVYAKDPLRSPQSLVNGPGAGNAQSPSGWLAGAQTTVNIIGNNVRAYLDVDANNAADAGGSAVTTGNFTATSNLAVSPATTANRAVAVQNLFYLNNIVHDTLYRHGFNEAAGNFQVNNFGLGGAGNDPVLAEAQDGSGTDNANFSTPNDGQSPRMQMYLWTGAGATHEVLVGASTYGAMGATFGPALSTTGLAGPLSVMIPADGCTAATASLTGKAAIIQRGTCDFTVKALNAQKAGAVGVIMVNNVGTTEKFTMGGTSTRVRIPSVMVGRNDGLSLAGLGAASATLRMKAVQPLQIDGDLDSGIVFHEYGHGLTWRMIGGMSGKLAGAVGEGASDVNAFLINGDDIMGDYAASSPLGIRRYRYASYPLTYGNVTGAEVHDDGEIYAAAMWRVLELYRAVGLTDADLHGDFIDGMNYTPATPAFENMRDGMLASITNRFAASGRRCMVWSGFAQYGIGVGATGTVSRKGVVSITPSFTKPSDCP